MDFHIKQLYRQLLQRYVAFSLSDKISLFREEIVRKGLGFMVHDKQVWCSKHNQELSNLNLLE